MIGCLFSNITAPYLLDASSTTHAHQVVTTKLSPDNAKCLLDGGKIVHP